MTSGDACNWLLQSHPASVGSVGKTTHADDDRPPLSDIVARALIQASPRFAGSIDVLYRGLRARHLARGNDVTREALAGVDADALGRRLDEAPEIDVLLVQAVEAGSRTALMHKRILLGRVVNQAVLDEAQVDRAGLVIGVLAQVDAPHIRCLEDVFRAEQAAKIVGEVPPRARGAARELVPSIIEAGQRHPAAVLTALRSLGLIDVGGMDDALLVSGVTEFGQYLLEELRAATPAST